MRKYACVKQSEMKDCGVACISMLVKYYKGNINREKLINMTKTTKTGTTAYHIKSALENIGFKAKGIKCSLDDFNSNLLLPSIASVTINKSYKHFIVIFEINYEKQYLIIGDPADKIKRISFKDFKEIFNNVLIIAYPIKSIPYDKDFDFKKIIRQLLIPNKKLIKNILVLSIFITIFSIMTSFYYQYMINELSEYSKNNLFFLFTIFFSIFILKVVSEYFRNILLSYINQKVELSLTLNVFNKIIDLPYRYFHNKQTGDIISKINDLDIIRDMISKVALSIGIDLPLALVSLIVLYIINSTLFNISLLILLLYICVIIFFKNIINESISKLKYKKSDYTQHLMDSIKGFETIKGCHIEKSVKNNFKEKYIKFLKEIFKFQNIFYIENLLNELINNIGFVLIIYIGSILVIKGIITLGSLITFSTLLSFFLSPIRNIVNLNGTLKESKIALRRISELINYNIKETGIINKFRNGDIIINDLSFSFNDKDYILKGVNLNIKKGSNVIVIGKSGSGKSTLFKLLMKYYKIDNNKIIIDNTDINNYTTKCVNNHITYIGQNDILFNDTLYNNIMINNSDNKKLLSISKLCELDEILDKNLGFNMLIEENGFNLSGGQKQRIILARALMNNFDILVIDEGLNQVDTDLERKILKRLFNYFKNKTIIFISHRLDNIDIFDKLIKFKDGQVKDVKRNA